ncbi:MAG: IPT/TIG domain-containing protein [Acidimicrobiia bacterium]|nr:IPT/TIG domain-containing protein [Acidimicrobiia bacterium]
MTDELERELRGVDGERPLPPAIYSRLESALVDDARARHTGTDDVAVALEALDAPRPVPASTRAALESALIRTRWGDFRSRVLLGAAAAAIVVVGAFALLRGGSTPSHHEVAVGPASTVPAIDVPAAQAPTTGAPSLQAADSAPGAASPAPTARSTTTTTWNCGLCARNGYTGSATPPTAPPSTATFQPSSGQPAAAAQALAAQQGVGTVDPPSGPRRGGTVVSLTGSGFTGATGVRFGSLSAVNFTVVSDGEIRVQTPPSPTPQKVTVVVTYADGSSTSTSDNGPFFTYT